jgi:hypothetical protein
LVFVHAFFLSLTKFKSSSNQNAHLPKFEMFGKSTFHLGMLFQTLDYELYS